MPNLSDLKKRIGTVQSTRQITRTMEMVSTAKIRQATERIKAAMPYAEAMRSMLAELAEHADGLSSPLFAPREEVKRATVIVVVSDRGLAGGFNHNVLKASEKAIQSYASRGISTEVITCGKKAISYFSYRKITPVQKYIDTSADPTIAQARQIARYVMNSYTEGTTDEVTIFYNHARNAADQDLKRELLIPILPTTLGAQGEHILRGELEYSPTPAAVLNNLLPDYIVTMIYRALLDSAAAEQGARRKAMKSATDNADEIISTLNVSYNRARQAAITTEITEIIGGAAALED